MGSSSAVVSTIVQNWREHPPSSYSLKVHNFSQLVNSTTASDDKYQSRLFSSGGYNWRLIVYPNGNGKDDGSGFISMYVEIDSKITTEVFAELRFFVYNKKENKYFTIQDLEVRRFNALKTVWGLQQFLPLDTFNDLKNGYIFEGGHCEFGVDVIVASPLTNWEILSFDEKLSNPKFSWAVKKLSDLKEHVYTSDSFSMGGRQWVLKMYPKGDSGSDGKWLSFYLFLAAGDTLKADEKVFRQGHIRVLDPLGSNHIELKTNRWVERSNTGWGWDQFLSLAELRKSYLDKKDTLNVEVEFEVVSATKYSTII
ncbi:probable inactive serine/threonine-protein kinase fnkC isoform X1 [Brassica napus]|nr:probable inactive serine/threonine-protein kinase fnkC isoform X1 [Brassica napus]